MPVPDTGRQRHREPQRWGPTPAMTCCEALRSALAQYATFRGRARRSEFWWCALFSISTHVVVAAVDRGEGMTITVVTLMLLVPEAAGTVRRLHDTNRSGWWTVIGLVPMVNITVLVLFCVQDSDPAENRFGPSPKHSLRRSTGGA